MHRSEPVRPCHCTLSTTLVKISTFCAFPVSTVFQVEAEQNDGNFCLVAMMHRCKKKSLDTGMPSSEHFIQGMCRDSASHQSDLMSTAENNCWCSDSWHVLKNDVDESLCFWEASSEIQKQQDGTFPETSPIYNAFDKVWREPGRSDLSFDAAVVLVIMWKKFLTCGFVICPTWEMNSEVVLRFKSKEQNEEGESHLWEAKNLWSLKNVNNPH